MQEMAIQTLETTIIYLGKKVPYLFKCPQFV
jgi:hypothetical protein